MPYCERCDRSFRDRNALEQHERDSNAHWKCDDCDRDFLAFERLKQHWIGSPRHIYCEHCDDLVDDDDDDIEDLEDHYVSSHHYCRKCERLFNDDHGLQQHIRNSSNHHYCVECERDFQSENGLEQHRKSSVHQPLKVKCCADGCDDAFVSQGHLCLHLEGGKCPSGIDRDILNREFRVYDKGNKFTVPYHELDEPDDAKYTPPEDCWNGDAYECPCCDATFDTVEGLRWHLDSPRHEVQMYRCPHNACKKRFTALSALRQHIDSESCDALKLTRIIKALDRIVKDIMRSM